MLLAIFKGSAGVCSRADTAAVGLITSLVQRTLQSAKYCVRYISASIDVAMFRILNVAEKNDAAKSLSDIMSAGRYTKVIVSLVITMITTL